MWDKTESTLIGDIAKDGLDIVDIDCKLKALKETRIPRLLNSKGILFNMKKIAIVIRSEPNGNPLPSPHEPDGAERIKLYLVVIRSISILVSFQNVQLPI